MYEFICIRTCARREFSEKVGSLKGDTASFPRYICIESILISCTRHTHTYTRTLTEAHLLRCQD